MTRAGGVGTSEVLRQNREAADLQVTGNGGNMKEILEERGGDHWKWLEKFFSSLCGLPPHH